MKVLIGPMMRTMAMTLTVVAMIMKTAAGVLNAGSYW